MKCLKPKNTDLLVVDIFVHVIILLGILLSFFVLVISKLETKELTGQITNQIDTNLPKLYKDIDNSSPDNTFKTLVKSLNKGDNSVLSIMDKYYDKPDLATESENSIPIIGALIVLISSFKISDRKTSNCIVFDFELRVLFIVVSKLICSFLFLV